MEILHAHEISSGERFSFGENWAHFLTILNDDRIREAEKSLCQMLKVDNLEGKRFLDVGSGSGLFSLAARRLGAYVHSFDYDPESVACTRQLKAEYFPQDDDWIISRGSVLDNNFLESLGKWDVVYSWGVLHHTGNMMQAFDHVSDRVASGGTLFIAIYNDQGKTSHTWLKVKKAYNKLSPTLRWLVLAPAFMRLWGPTTVRDILKGKPFHTWKHYATESTRGMSPWRDVVDWVGGLPFEVASPEKVFYHFLNKGFTLHELNTLEVGLGCNEFVFVRDDSGNTDNYQNP